MAIVNGQEVDNAKLTEAILKKMSESEKIQDIVEAEQYYAVENTAIDTKKREYIGTGGQVTENDKVSNVKLKNAFYRKSVKQKVDYAFGKPFIIGVEPVDENITEETDEEKQYQSLWDKFFNASNLGIMKKLARRAVNCGIGFIYLWIEDKELKIIDVPSDTIYPVWTDKGHTALQVLVRSYTDEVFTDEGFQDIGKAELWTPETVITYTNNGGKLEDGAEENHMDGGTWGKVPFIWLKGTDDEMPLLNVVKNYIDAYDDLNSQSVDTLKDDMDAAVIFKNYSADTGKLIDAYITLKQTKCGAVDSDGGISLLKNNPDITAIQEKLEHLKKDINEFSSTVNIQDIKLGNNPSGVAIKSAYQDLDTYTNDIETEFKVFIDNLKFFFDKYLEMNGIMSAEASARYKLNVALDRDMMINETELIDNIAKMQGELSQETLDDNNPLVKSHAIEQARREAEAEQEDNANNPFDFPDETTEIKEEVIEEENE